MTLSYKNRSIKTKVSDGLIKGTRCKWSHWKQAGPRRRDYSLLFAAGMDMVSAKFVLAVTEIWGAPTHHLDVFSAYVKAEAVEDYNIYLHPHQTLFFSSA